MSEMPHIEFALYSLRHVAIASLIGGPLGGFVILAINSGRLVATPSRKALILQGLLATVALCCLALILPERSSFAGLSIACTVALYQYGKSLQGTVIANRFESGGRRSSHWSAAGIGVASFVAALALITSILLVIP